MSRTQDDLPRWEGTAVTTSAAPDDGMTPVVGPESSGIADFDELDPERVEATAVERNSPGSDRDDPTTIGLRVGDGGQIEEFDPGRTRRRQALFGLLAACATFGIALLLTGAIGSDDIGDGAGDDVVTVDSTEPEPDLDDLSGSDIEDENRSGPALTVDSDGSEAAAPTTMVAGESDREVAASATSASSVTSGPSATTATPDPAGARLPVGRIVRDWSNDRHHESIAAGTGDRSWAVFEDFTLTLRGEVSSEAVLDEVRTRIENVVGPSSVTGEYEVVPETPAPSDPPLFVLAGVQFEDDSTTIDGASQTVLQLAFVLMQRYPQTEITVVHHSYPVGGALIDESVAVAETEAVVGFLVGLGVGPDRLSAETVAYEDRIASRGDIDDDRDGRWIDFVVRGLLEDS